MKLLKCFVCTSLLYGCETWTLKAKEKKEILEAGEMVHEKNEEDHMDRQSITNEEVFHGWCWSRKLMNMNCVQRATLEILGPHAESGRIGDNLFTGNSEWKVSKRAAK